MRAREISAGSFSPDLRQRSHDQADGGYKVRPPGVFLHQMPAACGGEPVIFGAAIVFGHLPFGSDPTLGFEALQGGVQRAELDI